MSKVGFIGLGWMGLGMFKCSARQDNELAIYDILEKPMDEIEEYSKNYPSKVLKCKTIKEVAENSDYVCVCVRDEPQHRSVIAGDDGLIKNMKEGSYIIIHGTLSPQFVREMHSLGKEYNINVIDGPMTGQKREEGQITVMVGSTEEEFKVIEPIIKPMGKIIHCGNIGAGEVTKLVNNIMASVNLLACTEALIYGVSAGVKEEVLLEQARNPLSAGNSFAVNAWSAMKQMKQIYKDTNAGPAALMYKDLSIVLDSADEMGIDLPITKLALTQDIGKLPEDYIK